MGDYGSGRSSEQKYHQQKYHLGLPSVGYAYTASWGTAESRMLVVLSWSRNTTDGYCFRELFVAGFMGGHVPL
jgi:hypothetical protein